MSLPRDVAAAALAPGARPRADPALGAEVQRGAGPRQGVPDAALAVCRVAGQLPGVLGGAAEHLAAHDEAVLVPDLVARGDSALARVERDKGPELVEHGVLQCFCVLDCDLEAEDTPDVVLPRSDAHNLVVQVPQHTSEVCCVDVHRRVVLAALSPVHVEHSLVHCMQCPPICLLCLPLLLQPLPLQVLPVDRHLRPVLHGRPRQLPLGPLLPFSAFTAWGLEGRQWQHTAVEGDLDPRQRDVEPNLVAERGPCQGPCGQDAAEG
mmetsp:Transcript_70683/g.206961  ORF Transcript_70683/g.206961 Transcript_70683/m.206961 type:complete len:265 (-) Transcript_70683:275-1069(-)